LKKYSPKTIIISGAIAAVITYFVYIIVKVSIYEHKTEFLTHNPHAWLFKDDMNKRFDSLLFGVEIRDQDAYYDYVLKDTFISVWEFTALHHFNFNQIEFKENMNLDDFKLTQGEVFNAELTSVPKISIPLELPFCNKLMVNLDENSKIIKAIQSKNYIGFYGNISKMSFSNSNNKHFLLFDYTIGKKQTLVLFYRKNYLLYFIMINSEKPFDETMINILNLD